jgi:uncharacterized protein (TIRG00374 family)
VLLILLLVQWDLRHVVSMLLHADPIWVALSTIMILPLMAIKTVRWQGILFSQSIRYRFWPAYVAYFAGLFVGFLTPGRLGELTKALYVWRDCKQGSSQPVSFARSFSGVIADRIFDLGAVMFVSFLALANLVLDFTVWLALSAVGMVFIAALIVLLNPHTFAWLQHIGLRFGTVGRKLFAEDGWITEIRQGLCQLRGIHLLAAAILTALAYGLYFWQCYWLSLALRLPLNYAQVSYVVALGGMVTLLPVSISGLGTREATMVAYLGAWGVPAEAALGFSLLVFATFYLGGSLIGAAAWLWRPTPGLNLPHIAKRKG